MLSKEEIIGNVQIEWLFGNKDITQVDQESLKEHFPELYEKFDKYHKKKLKHISRESRLGDMIEDLYFSSKGDDI